MNLRPVFCLFLALFPLGLSAGNWQYVEVGGDINRIEVVGEIFVAVTAENILKTSSDGISWQRAADDVQPGKSNFRLDPSGLTYFEFDTVDGRLMATISHTVDFENVELLYSTEASEDTRWLRPLWDDDVQIALLHGGEEFLVLRSEDGIEWGEVFSSGSRQFEFSYITAAGHWILASSKSNSPPGPWLQSTDKGLTWEVFNSFYGTYAILNGQYFGIQVPSIYQYSDDGINWFPHDIGFGLGAASMLSNGERIIIVSHFSGPLVSLDGFTYTPSPLPPVPNEAFNYGKNGGYDGEYFWIRRFSLTAPNSGITQIEEYFRSPDGFDWQPADMPEQLPDANQVVQVDHESMPPAVRTPNSKPPSSETDIHLGQLSIQLSQDSQTDRWHITQQRDGSLPEVVDPNWGGSYNSIWSVEPVKIISKGEAIIGLNNRRSIGVLIPSAHHLSQPIPEAINDREGVREIEWEAIEDADFYRIHRMANPYSANPLIQTVAEVTESSWQDESTSLIAGRNYFYRVSAHSQNDHFSLPSIWVRSLGSLKGIISETGMSAIFLARITWEYDGELPKQKIYPEPIWTNNLGSSLAWFPIPDLINTLYSWSKYHGWWYKAPNNQERHWQYDFLLGWIWVDPQNLPYIYDPAANGWMKSGAQADRIFSVIPKMVE